MPELIWKGKEQVMNHHLEVPVRCLDRRFTYNAEESGNRIIHGDKLPLPEDRRTGADKPIS